ncbi:olfactory receptor 2A14-like [Alosa pseudoharengus]|uniref:olfactory receptor 2A14-like n=1 Tax=Alosa pseudoharengus TaxID=34774 RepID=UPI003F8981D4
MTNSTKIVSIILTGYSDIGNIAYLYFTMLSAFYLCIIFANGLVIGVIGTNRTLQEPMYLFVCSLCVNELYGSTGLFPCLLVNLFSNTHEIPLTYCYIQIYCLYTYATVEYCNLSVMSYDRYMSICYPLQYNSIMTQRRVCILIVLAWSYSFCQFAITLSLNLRLQLCGNIMDKVWCDNYLLVRLSCSDTIINNIYGLYATVLTICAPLVLMLYSYIRIINISVSSGNDAKKKSLSTCAPHIVSLLNYSIGCSFEIIQSRLGKANIPSTLRVIISIYFLMIPPLVNPIMYGLKMVKIREASTKVLKCRRPFFLQ